MKVDLQGIVMKKVTSKIKHFYLTKTRYVDTYACDLRLWLYKNMPHKAVKSSLADQINMEQGTKVGVLATEMFEGTLVSEINKIAASKKTMNLLMNGEKYVFEATFIFEFTLVQVDILELNDDGTYNILEVKSSNSVKKNHYIDVAFQKWVLEQAGLTIKNCYLVHLNKNYVRQNKLVLPEFFKKEDITSDIDVHYSEVPDRVAKKKEVLKLKRAPKCEVGPQCKYPHQCPFFSHCHENINKDSVQKLSRLSGKKRSMLEENNIKYIKDIPASMELTFRQNIQRVAANNENKMIVNSESINHFLQKLVYPLYHLDFEATNRAIPSFKGAKPNQFFVYQYSIDREEENGKVKHFDYLHLKTSNPQKEIAKRLISLLGSSGSIIVWNQSFESARIREMANQIPECREVLLALIDRMVDLEVIFKSTWLYHHDMQGSSSIKYVLPFMCPDLSYSRLVISNGSDSQAFYTKLIDGEYPKSKAGKVIQDLKNYNNLDTWAMLRVLRRVKKIVAESSSQEE
jgi:predicted RecB family nuclease